VQPVQRANLPPLHKLSMDSLRRYAEKFELARGGPPATCQQLLKRIVPHFASWQVEEGVVLAKFMAKCRASAAGVAHVRT
jgi:hypothetical protein